MGSGTSARPKEKRFGDRFFGQENQTLYLRRVDEA